MDSNPEHRDNTRFPHEAPLTLENLEAGELHSARMFNFSDTGLYFESDYVMQPGTELYIGITNSPYAADPDVYECYLAEIKWRKPLIKSSFYYGYGARYLEFKPVEKKRFNGRELREHPRKKCSIPIKFAMQNKIHQGEIKDISLGGIFLKTANNVKVGQRLRLAIPIRKKGKVIKRSGKIVWSNKVGVGIKFQQTAGK
ncbi:MAG: PilZ domain-containing protein [Desulfobacterales bacterium]|jgi:Tfp pilus assembly protein PilZ